MTKEVKLNYFRHNIRPGDIRSKLEKAKEQYFIRSTMHQPYEARQALWKVRMYERQLYNPGACLIDKEGTDFVSPHPLVRLQDQETASSEQADCFPSYDVVKQTAKGKGISPESLRKAYQRVLKAKGQNTTKNSVRRDRNVKEIIEKAYFYDLAAGNMETAAPNNYPSFGHVMKRYNAANASDPARADSKYMRAHYDAHKASNSGVKNNGWSKKDWTNHILSEFNRSEKRKAAGK